MAAKILSYNGQNNLKNNAEKSKPNTSNHLWNWQIRKPSIATTMDSCLQATAFDAKGMFRPSSETQTNIPLAGHPVECLLFCLQQANQWCGCMLQTSDIALPHFLAVTPSAAIAQCRHPSKSVDLAQEVVDPPVYGGVLLWELHPIWPLWPFQKTRT